MFNGGTNPSACFKKCNPGVACTTFAGNPAGRCVQFGAGRPTVCLFDAGNREPCGNEINAGCADNAAFCVRLGDDQNTPQDEHLYAFCAVGCDANTPCATAGEDCSNQIQFNVGGGPNLGICAPVSAVADVCGVTPDAMHLCTGTEQCTIPAGTDAGQCTQP